MFGFDNQGPQGRTMNAIRQYWCEIRLFLILVIGVTGTDRMQAQTVRLLKLEQLETRLTAGKDTTYVLNFWATWCAPCVRELPYFQRIHQKFKNSPVKVLLISLDAKNTLDKKVVQFIGRNKITAEVFLLDETNQQMYIDRISPLWSGALPATLIVQTGKERKDFIEGEITYEQLEAALYGPRR